MLRFAEDKTVGWDGSLISSRNKLKKTTDKIKRTSSQRATLQHKKNGTENTFLRQNRDMYAGDLRAEYYSLSSRTKKKVGTFEKFMAIKLSERGY